MGDAPRILVVDDDRTIRDLVTRVLQSRGYAVIPAATALDALGSMVERLPDLILLDIMMPVMDGRDMLERVRHSTRSSGIPVVIMSAAVVRGEHVDGADAVLAKPFDLGELVDTVDRLLASGPTAGDGPPTD